MRVCTPTPTRCCSTPENSTALLNSSTTQQGYYSLQLSQHDTFPLPTQIFPDAAGQHLRQAQEYKQHSRLPQMYRSRFFSTADCSVVIIYAGRLDVFGVHSGHPGTPYLGYAGKLRTCWRTIPRSPVAFSACTQCSGYHAGHCAGRIPNVSRVPNFGYTRYPEYLILVPGTSIPDITLSIPDLCTEYPVRLAVSMLGTLECGIVRRRYPEPWIIEFSQYPTYSLGNSSTLQIEGT